MMAELKSPTVRTATRTHHDSKENDLDVMVNRWSNYGHDRLYLDGLFTSKTDVYVDLDDMTVTVSGTQVRSAKAERNGDDIVVEISRPSWNYEIVIGQDNTTDTTDTTDDGDDESGESDVDLEELGIGL